MARLPTPGGDGGNWGDILNDFLLTSHESDGSIRPGAVSSTALSGRSVTADTLASGRGAAGQYLMASDDEGGLSWENMPSVSQTATMNVCDFGAVGDGITNDTAALRQVFTKAQSDASGDNSIIVFPRGKIFIIDDTLDISGCHISGYGATIKCKNTMTACTMLLTTRECAVSGLTIDGNRSQVTSVNGVAAALYAYNNDGWDGQVLLEDLVVQNVQAEGIRCGTLYSRTDPNTLPESRCIIRNCTVTSCTGIAIMLANTRNVRVTGTQVIGNDSHGIVSYSGYGLQVQGCLVKKNNGQGIASAYGLKTIYTGNNVEENSQSGIVIGGGNSAFPHELYPVITSNTCSDNHENGITVDTTIDGVIVPVDCFGAVASNVCIGNGINGVNIGSAAGMSVTGNVCTHNGSIGVAIASARSVITGNYCTKNAVGIGLYGDNAAEERGQHRVGINLSKDNTLLEYEIGPAVTDIVWASTTTTMPAVL